MYLRIINDNIIYPYTIWDLKRDKYNVSFPQTITDEYLETVQMFKVYQTPKPNDYTKNIKEEIPQLIDGKYYQNWSLGESTEADINNRIQFKWDEIRVLRNELLAESDWTGLIDSPIKGERLDEWKEYRAALRDVTNQQNPFFIVWPSQPI